MGFFSWIGSLFWRSRASFIMFILLIASAGTAYYYYNQNQKTLKLVENPNAASEQEVKEVSEKVAKLMELPKDEKPTLITVVDKEKVKDQPFFNKSENGDKVLVYTAAKMAILYRPNANKIIQVGPVSITPNATFTATIYNGTTDANAVKTVEEKITSKVTNLKVQGKTDAKLKSYGKVIVVDVKGEHKTEAEQLAKAIDGEVGDMPANETKPDTDFLIIVGK